ncbi:MAG: Holliday junction branch migration protein RuvA [Terriglobia bacterium]
MITEMTGEVLYDRIQRTALLLKVDALCYEIFVPSGIASRLRHTPEAERRNPLTIYTIYYIEGGIGGGHLTPRLIGFLDPLDREFFEVFTSVPRVGFMRALKCLVRPVNEIAQAIERGDALFLKELPFIGAKTAELIVTELRGKMAKFALAPPEEPLSIEKAPAHEWKSEALQALEQLGYSRAEAQRMVEMISAQDKSLKSVEDFLRKVFEQSQSPRA